MLVLCSFCLLRCAYSFSLAKQVSVCCFITNCSHIECHVNGFVPVPYLNKRPHCVCICGTVTLVSRGCLTCCV